MNEKMNEWVKNGQKSKWINKKRKRYALTNLIHYKLYFTKSNLHFFLQILNKTRQWNIK